MNREIKKVIPKDEIEEKEGREYHFIDSSKQHLLVFYWSNIIDGGMHTSSQNIVLFTKNKKYQKSDQIKYIGGSGLADGSVEFKSFANDTLFLNKIYGRDDYGEWLDTPRVEILKILLRNDKLIPLFEVE